MDNIIDVQNLQFSYNQQPLLFKELNLTLPRERIIGVLGKNGAGKSTLLDLLLGAKKPVKGQVSILGKNPLSQREVLGRVAFCSNNIHLPEVLTVNEQIKFYLSAFSNKSNEKLSYYLKLFGLNGNQKIGSLSTGEKVKVQIVSSFLRDIDLLIVDEITAVLDVESRILFFSELKKVVKQRKISVVLATNLAEDLEDFADHVLYIDKGKVRFERSKNLVSLFTEERAL